MAAQTLVDIPEVGPVYQGATDTLNATPFHPETEYSRVPDRATLGCDWPYAVRRYTGSGVDSYHYQFQVLERLTRPPVSA